VTLVVADAAAVYTLRVADDCLVLSHRLAQWSSLAPTLAEIPVTQPHPVTVPAVSSSPTVVESYGATPDRITQPVLVISGDEDPIIRPAAGTMLARAVPHGRFVLVHRMGHKFSAPLWPQLISEIDRQTI